MGHLGELKFVAKKGQLWPVGLHLLIGLGVWPLHMLQQIGHLHLLPFAIPLASVAKLSSNAQGETICVIAN